MVVFAKSYPRDNPETLRAHTDLLLQECRTLKTAYGAQLLELIPSAYRESFWKALELCCKVHDLGKIHTPFQNSIRSALKMEQLSVADGVENVPHNILSPAFLSDLVDGFPRDIQDAIYQAVAFHHTRGDDNISNEGWKKVVTAIEKDIRTNLECLGDLFDDEIKRVKSNYRTRLLRTLKGDGERFFMFLKGLLLRIDHSASAHLQIETPPIVDPANRISAYLQREKRVEEAAIWQKNLAAANQGKSVVLQASTGSGKTEFTLFWLGNNKGFYTLPVRTSVNAMYDRLRDTYRTADIGLLHSDSYFYAIEESASAAHVNDQNTEGLSQSIHKMDLSRQLSMPLTVCTADQLFTATFRYKGYEKIYATLAYSRVIVDEIQSYDPDMVAVILKGLEDIVRLGGKFCLVTATLPKLYIDHIRNRIPEVELLPPMFGPHRKHRLRIMSASILDEDSLQRIRELYASCGKVLVIVNTVKRAQELYRSLKDTLPIALLHSAFIYMDRRKRESKNEEGSIMNSPRGVWVTTQLAEVSLDIDFPVMVTELSSIDSQVQRWGRIRRHIVDEYEGSDPNIFICTEASGIGTVYDKDLTRLSLTAIEKRNNSTMSQKDEYDIVQEVFESANFQSTSYCRRFVTSDTLLQRLDFTIENKREAQKIFRRIASVSFIPHDVYIKNQQVVEDALRLLSSTSDRQERLQALYSLKLLTVTMPAYKAKKINMRPITDGQDILSGTVGYDPETGIDFENLGGVIW